MKKNKDKEMINVILGVIKTKKENYLCNNFAYFCLKVKNARNTVWITTDHALMEGNWYVKEMKRPRGRHASVHQTMREAYANTRLKMYGN